MKFDHIGITTADLAVGRRLLEGSVYVGSWTQAFEDPVNDVWVQFGQDQSGLCYELVAPLSERSPIRRVLAQKVNTLNHVAYLVDDLAAQAARLVTLGFVEVAEARPAVAYGNRPIQFLVSQSRLLIELIEAPDHRHEFRRNA